MSRPALVSIKWLADKIKAPPKDFRILDASWHLPNTGRNALKEYHEGHIPGALFFDIDGCADKTKSTAHMLPPAKDFEEYVGNLGINNNTHVIVYDNNAKFGVFSAQRVWWTFRVFGHETVSILEGGLPLWIQSGNPVTTAETPTPTKESFKSNFNENLVISIQQVETNIKEKKFQLVDARPNGRFEGVSPEPRADIKPGHILNSVNLPFTKVVDEATRHILPEEELKKLFNDAGVDLNKPITASCGSGISACTIALAAYICGKKDVAVYDGSWMRFVIASDCEDVFRHGTGLLLVNF
ncbi:hypothetical protein LOTGIDRAFT_237288 [Lottia gigantea]|uniref:Rhodanese domain-containing protein n=1 Tax=Lottia gigantea TaxID=225164 RepID=V4BFJ4_LOTGI|nr:hypothetical protein LOTGIDRAFT_237288 [Lottia gigantea]ESP04642.1 hypothetical protein LOTGIDRAFT_237288 [Lottia gigantea]